MIKRYQTLDEQHRTWRKFLLESGGIDDETDSVRLGFKSMSGVGCGSMTDMTTACSADIGHDRACSPLEVRNGSLIQPLLNSEH